ncbi:hypothetical protein KKE78_00735 [Patescibacteria group bacterium]|nr:hypothetical protein [Patescibacteria group bacterium]
MKEITRGAERGGISFCLESQDILDLERRNTILNFLGKFERSVQTAVINPRRMQEEIFVSEACGLLNLMEIRTLATLRRNGMIHPGVRTTGQKREYYYSPSELALIKLVLFDGDKGCALKDVVDKVKPLIGRTIYDGKLCSPSSKKRPTVRKLQEGDDWFLQYGDVLVQVLDLTPVPFPERRQKSLLREEYPSNSPPEEVKKGNDGLSEESISRLLEDLSGFSNRDKMDFFSVRKAPSFTPPLMNKIIQAVLTKEGNFLTRGGCTDSNAVWDNLTFGIIERCLLVLLDERRRDNGEK